MKKLLSVVLAMAMMLCLVACGGEVEAPDLQSFYDEYMTGLGENAPMMGPVEGEMLDAFYAGLNDVPTKQAVINMAMIGAVAFEFALIEVENSEDVETVKTILEARKAYQVDGGAWYPETIASWEKAEIIVNGNVVALIAAGDAQADAVAAFNALFA